MKVQGGLGGIYVYATYTASTIAFVENTPLADTITDSAEGFLTAGFVVGMTITITGTGGGTKLASFRLHPGGPIQFWDWRNSPRVACSPRALSIRMPCSSRINRRLRGNASKRLSPYSIART